MVQVNSIIHSFCLVFIWYSRLQVGWIAFWIFVVNSIYNVTLNGFSVFLLLLALLWSCEGATN